MTLMMMMMMEMIVKITAITTIPPEIKTIRQCYNYNSNITDTITTGIITITNLRLTRVP